MPIKVNFRAGNRWKVIFLLSSFFISSCGTKVPYYDQAYSEQEEISPPDDSLLRHSTYLLGNIYPTEDQGKIIRMISKSTKHQNPSRNSLVVLGDLQKKSTDAHDTAFLSFISQFNGSVYVVPGDEDWDSGSRDGMQKEIALEQEIEKFNNNGNIFFPDDACPGPKDIVINDELVLIAVNSQWWLHRHEKPRGLASGCASVDKNSFTTRLKALVKKHEEKHILVVQHHPLFSNGRHGGFFSLKDHIFPLTLLHKSLYLPLPIIGSIYPILRYLGIYRQDIAHPDYTEFKEEMLSVLENRDKAILAAAHDFHLQYNSEKGFHHIISGASGKTAYAQIQHQANFVHQQVGFARVNYYTTGESWLEFFVPQKGNQKDTLVFQTGLYALDPEDVDLEVEDLKDYTDSTNSIAAGPEYEAGQFKKWWLGDHYRKEWITPVEVPLLDFNRENGGLQPVKKGGGNQTISLEVKAANGIHYDLRSVNKDPKGAVPGPLLNTFAQDVVQDQISSAHPYGALALPKMEEAINIYYPTPELFQIPSTPLLGKYYDDFAGMLVFKETELDEDLSEYKQFGYSKNVVSENTLYEHLQKDNDHEFDEPMFIKARLFDMLVGDWDRHDGQWGFAEFEKEDKGSIFRPIPKDRDQVFAKFDGVLPYLASRKWAVRKFSHFGEDFNDMASLNFNARFIDRRLLSSLQWEDWEKAANAIETQLTDEVIDQAIKDLPPEVYPISGPEIASKLKKRKPQLKAAAREYYEILAREVDIVASDKHEYFIVERLEDNNTRIQSYKTKKDGEVRHKLYDRTFLGDETREVRIYTREGNDSIVIHGESDAKILVRIIGGPDEDVVIDKTSGKNIIIYDDKSEENRITAGKKAKLKRSNKEYIHEYDMEAFNYDYVGPRVTGEINRDDGLYIGGGVKIKTFGFRKEPAATEHSILASYAFATNSYNLAYNSKFYSLFARNLDLEIEGTSFGPKFVFNYFGQGNASEPAKEDIDFYRVRLDNVNFKPTINYRFNRFLTAGLGPHFSYYYARNSAETILNTLQFDQPEEVENAAYFTGAEIFADLELRDHPVNPSKGVNWFNTIRYNKQLNDQKDEFTLLSTDVSIFYTFYLPFPLTAAVRFGASANIGDYKFYQSNFLGGTTNLRGFRRTRFAGQSMMFNNSEIRVEISEIHNYLFSGKWGLTGFIDSGRVWSDINHSKEWHRGYGPGVWLNVFELLLVSSYYGFSDEGNFFHVQFGHFF